MSIADSLMERRAAVIKQATEIAQQGVAESRNLSADENAKFDGLIAEAEALGKRASEIAEGEKRSRDLEESFRSVTGHTPEQRRDEKASAFGQFLRSARVGDGFDLSATLGAERRALQRVQEQRAVSASGGIGADGVYGSLWEYAVASSQLLQAGVQIINTADGNTIPFPVATVHATAATAAANAALTSTDPTFTTVNNTVTKQQWITLVPTELLQDASFDVEGYLARRAGIELARKVASVATTAYIAGYTVSGAVGPTGASGGFGAQATAGLGSDLLIDLFHSVLPEYRSQAVWALADTGAALVRKLKSSAGDPIWQPALTAGDPDLILGKAVYIDPNLPTPATSAKSIYFGDFSSLIVRIAGGMRFERSSEYAFGNDQVAFRGIVRTGASVLDPNAVKYFVGGAS